MKHTFILISTFLLATTVAFAQNTFRNTYTIPGNYLEWDKALQLSDGNFCMVGYHEYYNEELYVDVASMMKTDASGNMLLNKDRSYYYSCGNGSDYMYLAANTPDGNFVVGGESFDQGFLAKYDLNFNYQWLQQYGVQDETSYLAGIVTTPEHGFVLALQHEGEGAADALIKTDSNGAILWDTRYVFYGNNTISDLAKSADGNYVFAEVENSNNILVVKTDTAGNVLWSKRVEPSEGSSFNNLRLACSPSGSIYISASLAYDRFIISTDEDVSVKQPALVKLYADGSLAWDELGTIDGNIKWYNRDMILDKKGNVMMAGELDDFNVNADQSFIYQIDTTGALVASRQYALGAASYVWGLSAAADSTFMAVGAAIDGSENPSAFALKIGKDLADCGEIHDSSVVFADMGLFANDYELTPGDAGVTAQIPNSIQNTTPDITGASACSLLPVHLTSFTASLANGVVNLQWKTASEQNAGYYAVERSKDISNSFAPIKQLAARNLLTAQTYTAIDENPLAGTSYYRLRSVDVDGKSTVSKVVPINITSAGTIYISPNPVTDAVHVHINAVAATQLTLQVSDMAGKVLLMQQHKINAGANNIVLPAALSKGMYILKVTGNGKQQSMKFIK